MTWSAEKCAWRNIRGSAELSSAIGILTLRVFFSRGLRTQVCKKINTFLWVCQVFVLFFFVLWHLRPSGQQLIISARPDPRWQDVQAVCRPDLPLFPERPIHGFEARGRYCCVFECTVHPRHLPGRGREKAMATSRQPEAFEIITGSSMARRTWRTMVGAPQPGYERRPLEIISSL